MIDKSRTKITYSENSGSPEFVVALAFKGDTTAFSDVANVVVGLPFDETMTYAEICDAAALKAHDLVKAIARDEAGED